MRIIASAIFAAALMVSANAYAQSLVDPFAEFHRGIIDVAMRDAAAVRQDLREAPLLP